MNKKHAVYTFWDWTDLGLIFRVYKSTFHKLGIELQILWLNVTFLLFEKTQEQIRKELQK